MAIEKRDQIAKDTPEVQVTGSSVEVFPEASRADQIRDAAEILVAEEGILIGNEQLEEDVPPMEFGANLSDFIDDNILNKFLSLHGWYAEPYDAETIFFYKN